MVTANHRSSHLPHEAYYLHRSVASSDAFSLHSMAPPRVNVKAVAGILPQWTKDASSDAIIISPALHESTNIEGFIYFFTEYYKTTETLLYYCICFKYTLWFCKWVLKQDIFFQYIDLKKSLLTEMTNMARDSCGIISINYDAENEEIRSITGKFFSVSARETKACVCLCMCLRMCVGFLVTCSGALQMTCIALFRPQGSAKTQYYERNNPISI